MNDSASIEEEFEHGRQLCPDDSCIGVLSAEGVCQVCGAANAIEPEDENLARMKRPSSQGVDLVHRALCPDGSCIGVIGPDGRCKECGHVTDSIITDPRLRGLNIDEDDAIEKATASSTAVDTPPEDASVPQSALVPPQSEESGEFEDRLLCPDGACIGLIGSSGSCQECGTLL